MLTVDLSLLQSVFGLSGAPVVMALVNVIVKPWVSDSRWYPLAALVLGIAWNMALASLFGAALPFAAVIGVLTGLGAAGVYSAGKALQPSQSEPSAPDQTAAIVAAISAALQPMASRPAPTIPPAVPTGPAPLTS